MGRERNGRNATNCERNGRAHDDLSKRLADNVLEALVDYLAAPGVATSEHVRTISAALQALSVLAIAERVQESGGRAGRTTGRVAL